MDEREWGAIWSAAEDSMRRGEHAAALRGYQSLWKPSRDRCTALERVWLLLAIANASVRAGDYIEALEACVGAQHGFQDATGVVTGNPLFHLLAGLAYDGLRDSPDEATDHLARALITGGPAIFHGEAAHHLPRLQSILPPPADFGSWAGYEGSSRDLLNGATGYLAELLTHRLGTPPPYDYEPRASDDREAALLLPSTRLDLNAYAGACTDPVHTLPGDWGTGRQHLVVRLVDAEPVIRFYMPERPGPLTRLEYELLDDTLCDSDAIQLIRRAYFADFTDDYYAESIREFEIGPVGGPHRRIPYA